MNKLRFLSLGIFLLLFLNTQIFAGVYPAMSVKSDTTFQDIDLSKKKYYEELFTKDERKQLNKAESYLESAKKDMAQYNAYRLEIEKFYTIAEATSSSKSRSKAFSKARKLEPKALKKGMKSLDSYKKGNDIKTKIYTSAINRARLNDNSRYAQLGREIELQAKATFENAKSKERTAPQHDEQLKFNALNESNNLVMRALVMQENAFALYKKDPEIDLDNFNVNPKNKDNELIKKDSTKVVQVDSVLFPVYVEQYNPLSDPNLYRSKMNMIVPRLNLSKEELNALADANRKNLYANDLIKQVDDAYLVVDSLNFTADRTPDFGTRDRIRNMAIEREQTAFYKLTNATNIYIDVNETKYKIYKSHFPKVDLKKMNPQLQEAKRLESDAENYYIKAKGEIASANRQMYRSEQYIQLMGANDMLLYALQLQESAYGIYLNIPEAISAQVDTAFVTKNIKNKSVIASDNEKTSKNLSWEVQSTYTYSQEKPKPVLYKGKKGVIFLVQLGIFKGVVPAEKFGNIQPVIFDEFTKNPNRRFMVGEYRSAEAAEKALERVKSLGYTDAYIVSLIDGQRKSYSAGKEKLNPSDDHYNYLKRSELAKIAGDKNYQVENPVNDSPKEGFIGENSIKNTKGLVYLVQLGMYLKPITYDELKNLQPIYTDKIAGKGTRYMLGTFPSIEKARAESQRAVGSGMKDAYVIAYYNGEHISLDKAKKLDSKQLVKTNDVVVASSANIVFMVQIGAYRDKLNYNEEKKLSDEYASRAINTHFSDGMNLYTIGNYKTYKDADYLKKKLLSEGHTGVFVVAFNGNQKIPVEQAIKLNNK
jgi:cell division protein FtsN